MPDTHSMSCIVHLTSTTKRVVISLFEEPWSSCFAGISKV